MSPGLRPYLALVPLGLLALLLILVREAGPVAPGSAARERPATEDARAESVVHRPGSATLRNRNGPSGVVAPITDALAAGIPLQVSASRTSIDGGSPDEFTLQVRPMRALAEGFQVTLGAEFSGTMDSEVAVFEGWAVSPGGMRRGRATVAMANGALAAVVRHPDGGLTELKTDPDTGGCLMLRLGPDSPVASCAVKATPLGTVTEMGSESEPFTDDDWEPAEIAPQWGGDPATGRITKYEQPLPHGTLYERSLPDATVMVVLAKDATGSDSAANLASKASTYLARMANVATIWENQLGIRLLVSELVLTPDTAGYEDVGATLPEFRAWGESKRPRDRFPRSVAARFGNLGFSGNVIGTAYVGSVTGALGYSINKPSYNFTLVAHEMGHNFGSNHSAGGIMNASYQAGQRDFFRDVISGETAAMQIYNHSKDVLFGPAPLRNAEEIPFARDDSVAAPPDTPLVFEPLRNDDDAVRNGAANALSVAEVSRVFPAGAGVAAVVEDSAIVFTPADGFQGYAWFSYSLQGDVGNDGRGWLHRGDVAVLVGTDSNDRTTLTLAPGESVIFEPPGEGGASIRTPAAQALVDVTRDDNTLLVIRANADAAGTDAFVVRRSEVDHAITVTYTAQGPTAVADVIAPDPDAGSVRFNPMTNDAGMGYRRPLQRGARIGVDGTSEDYFVNALRLVSATNLNPEKGALTVETIDVVGDGINVAAPSGFLRFTPVAGAMGVADIEYVIEDAAGNQATGIASVVLSFVGITSPTEGTIHLPPGLGLAVDGSTGSSSAGALSGQVAVHWDVISAPPGAGVTIADPQAATTAMRFTNPGSYLLRVTGSDGGHATTRDLTVVVTDATAGGENLGASVALTDGIVDVAGAGPFDLSATLPVVSDDGLPAPPAATATRWSQTGGPGPVVFGDPESTASSATFPYPGTYTLRLTADDGAVMTFDEVTVNYSGPGNGVPVTSGITDVHAPPAAGDVAIDLFAAFEDAEDGDADLIYSLEANSNPALFDTVAITGDPAQLTLQFSSAPGGSSHLTVRATDTDGLFVDATFTVTITNAPPVIASVPDQVLIEGKTLELGITASDPDGHGLAYSLLAGSPPGMTINALSGTLSWTPGEADGPGNFPVAVKVVDNSPQALGTIEFFRVAVGELNEPPEIAPIDDIADFAQPDLAVTFSVTDPDLPANPLSFSLVDKPPGASIDGPSRTIHWTPTMAGTYAFTLRVDDGGTPNLSDTESFSVTVRNAAPTMADQAFSLAENSAADTEVGTVAASDGDGNGFTFAITDGNTGGAFAIDPDSGVLTVASSAPLDFETNASFVLTVTATDDAAPPLARLATITVNLTDLNEAPSLPDQDLEVAVGGLFGAVVGTVAASDPEDDPLTYAILSGNEAGVFAINPDHGEIRIAAHATLDGAVPLTVQVTDPGTPPLSGSGIVTLTLARRLVSAPADGRVLVPVDDSLSATWMDAAFDDSAWTAGQTGIGYERESGYESLISTDVGSAMYDLNASAWIRIPFTVTEPVSTLALRMRYDDGYVAYLNGQEIARRNAPAGSPAWNATAAKERDDALAVEPEEVDVSAAAALLTAGDHVLAIHVLNDSSTSPDLLLVPELLTRDGGTIGLTTLPILGSVAADGITPTSAILNGVLTFDGGEAPEVTAVWGTTDGGTDFAQWQQAQSLGVPGEGGFSAAVGGLAANTPYFFRFRATNSAGIAWSEASGTFTTAPPQLTEILVASGATARFLVPTDATDEMAWRARDYDDSGWTSGSTGIGYERETGYEALIGTNVENTMFGKITSVYLRLPFHVIDPKALSALTLRMKYDDACVAFVNGTEVARSPNAPPTLTWDAEATAPRTDADALAFADIDLLAAATDSLVVGENILAIHGLNDESGSPDLLMLPELVATYPEASYSGWMAGFPALQGDARLPDRNPDGDQMSNVFEFAYGWNPGLPEPHGPGLSAPAISLGQYPEPGPTLGGAVELRYRRRIDHRAMGLIYEVETTTDLTAQSWLRTFGQMLTPPEPTGDGITEFVTLQILDRGTPGASRGFFRIRASAGLTKSGP